MFITTLHYRPWRSDGHLVSWDFDQLEHALDLARYLAAAYTDDYEVSVESTPIYLSCGFGTLDTVEQRRQVGYDWVRAESSDLIDPPRTWRTIDGLEFAAFPEYGNWLAVDGRTLVCLPMLQSGEPYLEDGMGNLPAGEVSVAGDTDEEAEFFCRAVNSTFGTQFQPSDFPGR